jgi:hypothetical protein
MLSARSGHATIWQRLSCIKYRTQPVLQAPLIRRPQQLRRVGQYITKLTAVTRGTARTWRPNRTGRTGEEARSGEVAAHDAARWWFACCALTSIPSYPRTVPLGVGCAPALAACMLCCASIAARSSAAADRRNNHTGAGRMAAAGPLLLNAPKSCRRARCSRLGATKRAANTRQVLESGRRWSTRVPARDSALVQAVEWPGSAANSRANWRRA